MSRFGISGGCHGGVLAVRRATHEPHVHRPFHPFLFGHVAAHAQATPFAGDDATATAALGEYQDWL